MMRVKMAKTKPAVDKKELSSGESKSIGLAVILVRGTVEVTKSVKDTLLFLRLRRKNHCVVIKNTPINLGMLKKVKDYATWGEIDEETFQELVQKRGKLYQAPQTDRKQKYNYKTMDIDGKKYKPYFALNPPRKGFGRKGIKIAFSLGGALGSRREKINDLIKRML